MAIIGIEKLYNNNTENVEAFYKKHQQNPNNNGVRIIDEIMSIRTDDNSIKLIPGKVLSVRMNGNERTFFVALKGGMNIYLGISTEILTDSGYQSISNGGLVPSKKIALYKDGKIEYKSIINIEEINSSLMHYEIRVKNTDNYLLDRGIIVKAD